MYGGEDPRSAARVASALNLSDRHMRTLSRFGITPGGSRGVVSIPGIDEAQTLGRGPLLVRASPQEGWAPRTVHAGDSGRGGETSTATSAMLAVIQAQADELSEMRRSAAERSANSRDSVHAARAASEANEVRVARERQDMLAKLDATGRLLARREEQLLALGAGQSAHSASRSEHGAQQRPRLGEEAAELRTKVAEQGARLREGEAYARMLEGEVARLKSSLQLVQRVEGARKAETAQKHADAQEIARLAARVEDLERELEASRVSRCVACDGLSEELCDVSALALRARFELAGLGRLVRQLATRAPLSVAALVSLPSDHDVLIAGNKYKDGARDLEAIMDDLAGLRAILIDVVADKTAHCAQQ